MDNIIFERIWQCDDFFEIKIIAQSKKIWATTVFYTVDIFDLASSLTSYTPSMGEYYWGESVDCGDEKNFSLRVFPKDRFGHIFIEIYMKLRDCSATTTDESCSFVITTELGLLNTFGKSLLLLNKPIVGTKISLVEE